jgi:methanogenic corrinoid protein MtbC1
MKGQQALFRKKRHPIKVVAHRTGLSPEVLRVWEKRYAAVEPGRTKTDRRLYSDADIERLRLLRQATLLGRRIGEISGHSSKDLAVLVREDREATAEAPRPDLNGTPPPESAAYLSMCLKAVRDLDAAELDTILSRAVLSLSSSALTEDFLAPLSRKIGELWEGGRLKPYHEHMASVLVRQTLGITLASGRGQNGAARLVVTTPSGQRHEIGAVLAAVAALSEGWNVLYLGPDLPATDIAQAVAQSGATAVALSIVYPEDDPAVHRQLKELRSYLGEEVALIVGGAVAGSYAKTIHQIGGHLLSDTRSFRALLGTLHAQRPAGHD